MSAKFLNGVNNNNKQIINVADGSAPTDAVNIQQLDAVIRSLDWKPEVKAASTANINLAAPGATLDGYTLVLNDRFLAKDQTLSAQNGIYQFNGAAAVATRTLDADSGAELSGSTVTVQQGTVNGDRVYRVTADDPLVVGTTAVTFVQVGAGSTPYTAGNGLVLAGQDFNVGAGTGITVNADDVAINISVVVRKYAANCVATTNPQTFAHGLGTADLTVNIYESGAKVYPDITADSTNVTVDWGGAPTSAQYRVVAHG